MIGPDGTIKPWREMIPEERVADQWRHFPTLLDRWRGGRASFWKYSVSHQTLSIRIERPAVLGNMHVDCSAVHISGPVSWEDADITISLRPEGDYLIEDRRAGLRVLATCVSLHEDVNPVYEGS